MERTIRISICLPKPIFGQFRIAAKRDKGEPKDRIGVLVRIEAQAIRPFRQPANRRCAMHYGWILTMLAGLVLLPVPAATDVRADFSSVVTQILMRQTQGPLSEMSDSKRLRMVHCINNVLDDLPKGKKRYVLDGSNLREQERRFGRIVFENRAEWIQKIAGGCARVAMGADV
jgi:hypothetical protein